MSAAATLARWGFDPERLRFTTRTAIAACCALLLAWALGLEHPQWSAMTVWAASQPTRGQLLEKGFFRFAGTVSGTLVGVTWLSLSGHSHWMLMAGIASWIALCAGIGNLQRGYVGYGTILAGYSAAMVALLDSGHPERAFALGGDRLATVLLGVLAALTIGWLLTPKAAEGVLSGTMRRLCARVLHHVAADPMGSETRHILSALALQDEILEPHGAGSLRSRRAVQARRGLLIALTRLLLEAPKLSVELANSLQNAAGIFDSAAPITADIAALGPALARADAGPGGDMVRGLHTALGDVAAAAHNLEASDAFQPVPLHLDWTGAAQTLLRSWAVMLAIGAVWAATDWQAGPFMMLGTAVMISLFSTFDDPAWIMFRVFLGQVGGAGVALICQFLVWPLAQDQLQMVLLVMPFIFLGVPVLSHRRTAPGGMDYVLILLLLLQPRFPQVGGFIDALARAGAVAAAPFIAYWGFRMIFPTTPARRLHALVAMMVRELQSMAAAGNAGRDSWIWRTRHFHRLLRLVRWQDKASPAGAGLDVVGGGVAVLTLGDAIHALRDLRRDPSLGAGRQRAIAVALARLGELASHPDQASRSLAATARRLDVDRNDTAALLRQAARDIAAQRAFLSLAS